MEQEQLRDVVIRAACYLHEGDEHGAIDLLLSSEVEFIPEHDYVTETDFRGHNPDTFVLSGPRKVVEAHRQGADEWKQLEQAFEAAYGYHVLKVSYKPAQSVSQPWRQDLAKALPALDVVDAEYTVSD